MNNNTGGTFRTKRNPFTQVSNSALRDDSLSLKAKGLYSLIQSYITMPDFTLYKWHLMKMCKEKEKAFNSAWKELKDNGYLKQYRIPKGANDTFVYEYELLDIADLTTPSLINLNKNGEEIKNVEENIEPENVNSHTPPFVPYADGIQCHSDIVPIAPYAKWVGYNNIDLKKDFNNNIYNNENSGQSYSSQVIDSKLQLLKKNDVTDNDMNNSATQKKEFPIPPTKKEIENPTINVYHNTYAKLESIVKNNIDYFIFIQEKHAHIKLIDSIVYNIVTILAETNDIIVLNKKDNTTMRTEIAQSICLKLTHNHILYLIEKFNNITYPITDKKRYLQSMILNSLLEMEAYNQNEFVNGNL